MRFIKGLQNAGVDAYLFQVPETLPPEVLEKMHAPPKPEDVPVIQACQLPQADGFIFGVPTRFGMLPAQMKAFFDSCGQLWMKGAL
jgi:NAD(P)H dehydrogenase (quinone)